MRLVLRPLVFKPRVQPLLLLSSILFSSCLYAQSSNGGDNSIHVWPVRDNIFMLIGAGSNITASVGPDGVLLVDTGLEQNSEKVLDAISQLQERLATTDILSLNVPAIGGAESLSRVSYNSRPPPKPIRYIINTHAHPDHTGGNARIAATGLTYTGGNVSRALGDSFVGAAILSHENVLLQMLSSKQPVDFDSLPTETYFVDEMKLSNFFNGEGVRLIHMPAAHTDGDSIVYFRGSDVISTGDIFSMDTYPIIDVANGGNINGIIDALNYILKLAIPEFRTEGGTMIIPGHGRLADSADVGYYRDMVTILRDRVQALIDDGMSLEQVQAAKPSFGYDGRFGSADGYWTTRQFIEAVYLSLVNQ